MTTEPTSMRPRGESGSLDPLTYKGIPLIVEDLMGVEVVRVDPALKDMEDMVAAMKFEPLDADALSSLTITNRFGTRTIQQFLDALPEDCISNSRRNELIEELRADLMSMTTTPGDQEMSPETVRCPVCTANYNPITNSDQCPHRQHSHTLIDPTEKSPDLGPAPTRSTVMELIPKAKMEHIRPSPVAEANAEKPEIPSPGRIVYIMQKTESDDLNLFIAPAMVVASKGYTNLEPVQHGTTVLLRRMDEPIEGEGCLDPLSLFQHISEIEYAGGVGWDWMPYQKGQAKKLEEVQSIEWMGLRTSPSVEDLERRFTYHPPTTEEKIQAYQSIRSRAEDLASLLVLYCPPSPELASALDHLDTVVFKANASIARHG